MFPVGPRGIRWDSHSLGREYQVPPPTCVSNDSDTNAEQSEADDEDVFLYAAA